MIRNTLQDMLNEKEEQKEKKEGWTMRICKREGGKIQDVLDKKHMRGTEFPCLLQTNIGLRIVSRPDMVSETSV